MNIREEKQCPQCQQTFTAPFNETTTLCPHCRTEPKGDAPHNSDDDAKP